MKLAGSTEDRYSFLMLMSPKQKLYCGYIRMKAASKRKKNRALEIRRIGYNHEKVTKT